MTLYLDTSSLVKLYVSEVGSDEVHELIDPVAIVATSIPASPSAVNAVGGARNVNDLCC